MTITEPTGHDPALARIRAHLGDRYELVRELGRGGMGTVFLARDRSLDRPVALKVLPPEFAAQGDLRERFLRETRTAAGFSHPNIVPVFAVEESGDFLAFAMGFVEGETLAQRVKRAGPLGLRDAVRLLQDVGYALSYAHGRGVVHRDIKPDNIILERATGRALVMDFGIARSTTAAQAAPGLTRVGEVVGTPEFMSPEQATGDAVDGRSDLYSLGLVAFFALTGQLAITGETTQKILARQLTQPAPPILTLRPELPPELAEVVDRCLVKEPEGRLPSAEALVEALEQARLAGPVVPLPIRLFAQEAGTLGLILAFASVITWLMIALAEARGRADLDTLLPAVLLLAIVLTRVSQALSEAWRVGQAGFTRDEFRQGMRAVLSEREARRVELRADPVTRRRRRFTLFMAAFQAVAALLMIRAAFRWRTLVPGTSSQYHVHPIGVVLVVSGVILVGTALMLFLRSPFRMTLGERLFRLFWLGGPGALFLRLARVPEGRAEAAGTRPIPSIARVEPPPSPAGSGAAQARLARLEARVEALEEWRGGAPGR